MAFTATINSVNFQNDQWQVAVTFNDSASGWTSSKTYQFPSNETQAQAVAVITADGTAYKANLATLTALQSKVGSVITI
jgi:uncharacterized protein (DUF2141 family)